MILQNFDPEKEYEHLYTELEVCVIGGLFLALYQDEEVPKKIITRLQNELSEQFNFELYLNEEKNNFPIFFRYTFEEINKHPNVYHVLGLDNLNHNEQKDFIRNLQYNRDNFKSLPYSLVFWVKPELVKNLFHNATDFYHWLFGIYDFSFEIAQQPVFIKNCEEARRQLKNNDKQFLAAIHQYLEKLVWQYENWQEIERDDFLNEVMSRVDLNRYYVDLKCTDHNNKTWLLDNLLDHFMANPEQSFLALLGDFGTGKSCFSLHYFIEQARNYLKDPSKRIPLFISLREYPKKFQVNDFIENEFLKRMNSPFYTESFQNLALQGRFFYIFDGFDEMVSMQNERETIENFKTISRLTFENLQLLTQDNKTHFNKIFLTCRTHYFLNNTQEQNILKADKTILYRDYAQRKTFLITSMNIQQFGRDQVEEFIRLSVKTENQAIELIELIDVIYNLKDLASRPILLDMIVKTLPLLKNKDEINAAVLYQSYTSEWIERDDWRACLTINGKRQTMWNLATGMHKKGGDFSLHYTDLALPNRENFKLGKFNNNRDYFIYDATTCSFLNRNHDGNYKFIHKSFMEFFLAEYLFDKMQKAENNISNLYINANPYNLLTENDQNNPFKNHEISFFILNTILSDKSYIIDFLDITKTIGYKKRPCYSFILDFINRSNVDSYKLFSNTQNRRYILIATILKTINYTTDNNLTTATRKGLINLVRTPKKLDPQERAEAGRLLAFLGDNREGVGVTKLGLPDIKWKIIPAGKVKIGRKAFKVPSFKLATYLITNQQFQCFIDDPKGYSNSVWWPELNPNSLKSSTWEEPNHPKENISWFEAVAFCRWISDRLGFEIVLPSEWQWQLAACSKNHLYNYPWGSNYKIGYANIIESWGLRRKEEEGRTTAVGIYPQGNSCQGVSDLVGNVWEWCSNEYESFFNTQISGGKIRAIRGGNGSDRGVLAGRNSIGNDRDNARIAYRGWCAPNDQVSDIGFRVCCKLSKTDS